MKKIRINRMELFDGAEFPELKIKVKGIYTEYGLEEVEIEWE